MVLQDWKSGLEFTENELRQMGATLLRADDAPKGKKKKKKGWMSVPEDGDAPTGPQSSKKRSGSKEFQALSQVLDTRVDEAFDGDGEYSPSLPVMASGALQASREVEQEAGQEQEMAIPITLGEDSEAPTEAPAPSAPPASSAPPAPPTSPDPPEGATQESLSRDPDESILPHSKEVDSQAENSHEGVFRAFSSSGEISDKSSQEVPDGEKSAAAASPQPAPAASIQSLPPSVPSQKASAPPVPPESAAEGHATNEAPPGEPSATGAEDDVESGPRETVRMYSGAVNTGAAPPPVPGEGNDKRGAAPPPVPEEKPKKGSPPPVPAAGAEGAAKGAAEKPPPPPATEAEKGGAPPPVPASKDAKAPEIQAKKRKAPAGAKKKKRKVRKKPWFEDFFNDDYLLTLPYETPEATASEAHFIEQQLELPKEKRLLDLGCGYGRHAVELAKKGYQLVGLDNSLPMLLKAAEMGEQHGVEVNFMHGDMKEMIFEEEFDGVYCFNTSFGYFDDDTNRKVLGQVFKALKAGGRFLLEVVNRDFLLTDLPLRVWWEGEGCVVMEEVEFNYFTSRVESNRSVVFNDGRQVEHKLSVRVYSLHELGKLLHREGFIVREVTGNLATAGRFFGPESPHLIIKSEKKGKHT